MTAARSIETETDVAHPKMRATDVTIRYGEKEAVKKVSRDDREHEVCSR